MFRSLAPVILIPAAWILTLVTVFYPGIDVYWIEHMHYFMFAFLTGFIVLSWNEMESEALSIWRNVILLGVFTTGIGALSFNLDFCPDVLAALSLFYWLGAPGIAAYFTSELLEDYKRAYRFAGYAGVTAVLLYLQGYIISSEIFKALGIVTAAVSQSYIMIVAAKMDEKI